MPSAISSSRFMGAIGVSQLSGTRGRNYVGNFEAVQQQSLPTDPVGVFSLTLTNVVVGSSIQVEDQAGTTTLYNGTATDSTVILTLSAYAGGSALNNLRIKVRKGSAPPYYQPYETQTVAAVGAQSIFVSQIPD